VFLILNEKLNLKVAVVAARSPDPQGKDQYREDFWHFCHQHSRAYNNKIPSFSGWELFDLRVPQVGVEPTLFCSD
jgi:hypothetical protein